MDQNISAYMILLRNKKWWWPLFRFCVDVAVNNAFQMYCLRKPKAGEPKLNALEFRWAIAKAYYLQYDIDIPQVLFLGSRLQPREHVRFCATNHWIVKGTNDDVPNQDAQESPGAPAKLAMLIYILIVLNNTIFNRQCYVVRHMILYFSVLLNGSVLLIL